VDSKLKNVLIIESNRHFGLKFVCNGSDGVMGRDGRYVWKGVCNGCDVIRVCLQANTTVIIAMKTSMIFVSNATNAKTSTSVSRCDLTIDSVESVQWI
jgi:hypothetical protein